MDVDLRNSLSRFRELFFREFDREKPYLCNVEVIPEGPCIRRHTTRVDEYWRFMTLAERLEPVLLEAGVKFRDGKGATPDGRVLYWANGRDLPPQRVSGSPNRVVFLLGETQRMAVSTNDDAFFLVALAIDVLLMAASGQSGQTQKPPSAAAGRKTKSKRMPDGKINDFAPAYLDKHHGREGFEVADATPVVSSRMAREIGCSTGVLSNWFAAHFPPEGHSTYAALCARDLIGQRLRALSELPVSGSRNGQEIIERS